MLIEGILFLIYRVNLCLFESIWKRWSRKWEVYEFRERFRYSTATGLEYFCWDTVHTSSFLEPDFEMKDCIFSLVIGLKSKGMGVWMLDIISWQLGWVVMSQMEWSVPVYLATLTCKSLRTFDTEVWSDMIKLSSEIMIVGCLKCLLFYKKALTVGQKYFDLGPPAQRSSK